MIVMDVECKFCWGNGKIHSDGRNGDPMDEGENCPICKGAGVVQVDCVNGDEIRDES
jgi:DnaJ-class molecular chaperone